MKINANFMTENKRGILLIRLAALRAHIADRGLRRACLAAAEGDAVL
jgi:hypothetical protein